MTTQFLTNPRRRHKDVEFHVDFRGTTRIFQTWDEAAGFAVTATAALGEVKMLIDIVIWSEAGARWWFGDEGVEMYREDPEASVFQRIEVKANDWGRVP